MKASVFKAMDAVDQYHTDKMEKWLPSEDEIRKICRRIGRKWWEISPEENVEDDYYFTTPSRYNFGIDKIAEAISARLRGETDGK